MSFFTRASVMITSDTCGKKKKKSQNTPHNPTNIDGLQFSWINSWRAVEATSFPGSLFYASLSRWNRDPGCGWSRDYLFIQNRRVGGYLSKFGGEDDKVPHPSSRFLYHPDSGWSRDEPKPGPLFQLLREAERRDPGNEVTHQDDVIRTRLQVARLWD